ncbi:hypothetical protein AGDE_12413 [Angomonas deanei]|uniref:Spermine/spermidine synthase n=1 Tax=Angomonas deanei TaxID=59799 RepID=A0A7G2C0K1_9TRYP|nr:hypothetical protein AGDE_12413 [Angomonas deanei]CAD2213055.1 hypothetical protein, conserved [Angomonas deanei]|eukprot:EPY24307.1 hypothetical protein AGDE_12413 [Angomonas deanei]
MPPDGSRKRGRPSDSPVAASHVNVLRGVTQEFDRTLPFWRCFTDLKSTYGHPPIVQQRTTTIHFREACSSFKGVDVVWAITKVTVRVQTGIAKRQNMRIPEKGRAGVTWRGIPYKEVTWRIGTMHFVHQNMNGFSGEGYEKSFHIQSVVNYDCPAVLQCVAGTMVSFWLLLYSSVALLASDTRLSAKDAPRKDSDPDAAVSSTFVAREEGSSKDRKRIPLPAVGWLDHAAEEMALQCKTEDNRAYVRAARQLAPHSTSRILVLGMGGNSMAVALRLLLGPHAEIHVVEIDASVFRACKAADTLLESDTKQFVYVESAEKCLPRFVNNYFHFIFMDLFEPLDATMVMTSSLVGQCHAKLSFGGMLVVNDHPTPFAGDGHPVGGTVRRRKCFPREFEWLEGKCAGLHEGGRCQEGRQNAAVQPYLFRQDLLGRI